MGLRLKFNVILLITITLGYAGTAFIANKMLQNNAREETLLTIGIMMESAMAIRKYTVDEIKPLLAVQIKRDFLPQTVPAYAATKNIMGLRQKYPEYTYKEATLNPTNPVNRSTDWETSLIEHFRNNPDVEELIGTRESATGTSLYLARPIQIKKEGCLTCHGRIQDAPETMRTRYGESNGFGWKLNEVVGTQLVNVPMSIPLQRAEKTFHTFMISIGLVFISIIVVLNILLNYVVIQPVKNISSIAHDVSMGKLDAPECDARGKDEIALLAGSISRLRRSLENAMKMLNE